LTGAIAALLGFVVLAAWVFDISILKSLDPAWATMKPNAALGFLLAGSALWSLTPVDLARGRRLAGSMFAATVGAIALVTIAAYAFDYDFGIDQLLFADRATPASLHPGRPAPTTAGFFVLIAAALLLLRMSGRHVGLIVDLLAGAVVAGAYLAIIGYLYDAPSLYTVPGYSAMALHAGIGHLLLGAGIFLAQPDRGLMRLIMSPRAAGATARRLLPVAVFVPVLLGFAPVQAVKLGLLAPAAAGLLLIVAFVASFAATILWSVAAVDKVDAERQRLELAGRLAEEHAKADRRFRSLLESAPDAAIVADPQGRIILVNAQTEQLFGYAREALLGAPIEILIPERLRTAHVDHRAAYHRAPRVRPMGAGLDLIGRRRDGSEFPVEVSLSPVQVEDGPLVCAAIRDSSARRRREAELVEARTDAEAASRRLRTLIAATPLAIVEVDRKGCVCSWNPAAEKMFGWRADELIGRPLPTIPADRRAELKLLLDVSSTVGPLQAFETRRLRKDGSSIDVSVWTAPRRAATGAIDGSIGIIADTTEQKRTEEHLRQSQRLKAVGQLTGRHRARVQQPPANDSRQSRRAARHASRPAGRGRDCRAPYPRRTARGRTHTSVAGVLAQAAPAARALQSEGRTSRTREPGARHDRRSVYDSSRCLDGRLLRRRRHDPARQCDSQPRHQRARCHAVRRGHHHPRRRRGAGEPSGARPRCRSRALRGHRGDRHGNRHVARGGSPRHRAVLHH
jgi:PAS domain S-box-containing protein